MIARPRLILAFGSVAIVVLVVGTGIALGPEEAQRWLLLSGLVATVAAIQSVGSDPGDLAGALVLSLPPVLALLAEGSPSWLIGPLGALLLVAGELSALSWECQGKAPLSPVRRRRLLNGVQIGSLGLAAAFAIGLLAPGQPLSGTVAMVLAAAALAGVGRLLFRG